MKWVYLTLIFFTHSIWAFNPYELKSSHESVVCDNTFLELKNTPPLREQGSIGICFAFSSLLLLEHLKCSEASDPSNCYSSQRGSAVDMTKFLKPRSNEVYVGGDPLVVLHEFSSTRKLVNESCTYLENWKQLGYEPQYLDFFHQIHKAIKDGASNDEVRCYALNLNEQNLGPVDELYATLLKARNMSVGQLRTAVLYKKNCTAPDITYPQYNLHTYPTDHRKTHQGIFNFVKKNLEANSPVEVSFCAEKDDQGQCYYHSTVITGMRNVCSQSKCTVQYKIQNSYGKAWQDMHDDGWVNSKHINEDIINTPGLALNSITPVGKSLKESSYTLHSRRPTNQGSCGQASLPSNPNNQSTTPIFECRDAQGRIHFSSEPLSGMFCRSK